MKITNFLSKNKISLTRSAKKLCEMGSLIMKDSKDPLHDIKHVEKLIEELDYLINKVESLKIAINYEVLLPAICWHDTWNTDKKITNIPQLIIYQIFEGLGSSNLYKMYAKSINADMKIIKKTAYCIRKHSSFQIFPPLSLEAKILIDLDKLELWNVYRFIQSNGSYVGRKEFYKKYLVRLYLAYSSRITLYFKILDKRFAKYKKNFWEKIIQD